MKKKIITLVVALCFALGIQAQKMTDVKAADVPAAVQASFQKNYPDATGADWKMREGKYKVEFRQGGNKYMAGFDETGMKISHGNEIKPSELPEVVTAAITKNHPGSKIDDVYKIEKEGKIHYKIELDGNTDKKVIYSAEGELIKEKVDK